jgi:hypothetical protein
MTLYWSVFKNFDKNIDSMIPKYKSNPLIAGKLILKLKLK